VVTVRSRGGAGSTWRRNHYVMEEKPITHMPALASSGPPPNFYTISDPSPHLPRSPQSSHLSLIPSSRYSTSFTRYSACNDPLLSSYHTVHSPVGSLEACIRWYMSCNPNLDIDSHPCAFCCPISSPGLRSFSFQLLKLLGFYSPTVPLQFH